MKKTTLVCLFLIMAILCGCQSGTRTETQGCTHPETELIGNVKYVYGPSCDDMVEVYLTCNLCGTDVYRGKRENDIKCGVSSGKEIIIKEPTCTEVGRAQGNCDRCGKLKEWDIPVIDHHYLWFYGDDTPSCAGCGLTTQPCDHAYEMTNDNSYTASAPGSRYYQCKNCQDAYTIYYDAYGDYDLRAVVDAVCRAAQESGWTVIEQYNLNTDYISQQVEIVECKEINAETAAQILTDAGMELLDYYNDYYPEQTNNRADYYLMIDIDLFRDAGGKLKFAVCFQIRYAD